MVDGVLVLTGNDLNNSIQVNSGPDGAYTVHGRGTLINGRDQSATFSGVDDIRIEMNGGDDSVAMRAEGGVTMSWPMNTFISDVNIHGNLTIDMGDGDDMVNFHGFPEFTISDPDGNGQTKVQTNKHLRIGGNLRVIDTGPGEHEPL